MQKMSTGLCQMLLGGVSGHGDLKTIIDGLFKLFIYGGTPPATADAAVVVSPLVTCTNAGAALNMDTVPVGGVLPKKPSETWAGTVAAGGGTATFYRFQTSADAGSISLVLPRIQGTIAVGGADMNLGTVALIDGATFTVNYFVQAFVPS